MIKIDSDIEKKSLEFSSKLEYRTLDSTGKYHRLSHRLSKYVGREVFLRIEVGKIASLLGLDDIRIESDPITVIGNDITQITLTRKILRHIPKDEIIKIDSSQLHTSTERNYGNVVYSRKGVEKSLKIADENLDLYYTPDRFQQTLKLL